MWKCKYCGGSSGMYYKDNQLEGMLCLEPECGRFNDKSITEDKIYESDI